MKILFYLLAALCLLTKAVQAEEPILLVSNGWHTGFVIPRQDIPSKLLPEMDDFDPSVRWFEIGWGSAVYYPARHPDWKTAIDAAFPGGAVLHIAGLSDPYDQTFPGVKRIPLCPAPAERQALIGRILGTMERKGAQRVSPSYAGLYPFSLFYPAKGSFHLLHTCNSWTSEILGLPVTSPIAWGVAAQVSPCPK